MLAAGRLRTKGTFRAATASRGTSGEAVLTWPGTAQADRWFEDVVQGGREFMAAQQRIPETTHLLRTRYLAGIKPAWRLYLADGRILEILAAYDPDGRHRDLHVACREVVL